MSLSIWMKSNMLPQFLGLLKLILNLFDTIDIQGRELCWCDFIKKKNATYIFLCQDTCKTESLQTRYNARHDWTLQSHINLDDLGVPWRSQSQGKGRSSKVVWSHSNVHNGRSCKSDDCEEIDEYGSYERLLFLFINKNQMYEKYRNRFSRNSFVCRFWFICLFVCLFACLFACLCSSTVLWGTPLLHIAGSFAWCIVPPFSDSVDRSPTQEAPCSEGEAVHGTQAIASGHDLRKSKPALE